MSGPEAIHVSTRSGSVRVVTADGAPLTVEGGSVEREADGILRVRRNRDTSKIVVHSATGTDLTIGTVSGSVELTGRGGVVRIATASGKISVEAAARLDVRNRSGTVDIGAVTGVCRVVTTSAKVRIASAELAMVAGVSGLVVCEHVSAAEIKTVSGKVALSTNGPAHVRVHTVSGRVDIVVPPAVRPATQLRSVSGRVDNECPPGTDGDISVASVSGRIKVSCA